MLDIRNPLAPIIVGSGFLVTVNPGNVLLAGVPTSIASAVISLTASATNYVHVTSGGVISVNTTGFPTTSLPIAQIVCSSTSITSITDSRPDFSLPSGSSGLSLPYAVSLPNAKFISINTNLTSTGNIDLYTVPAGRRAILLSIGTYNYSGGSAGCVGEIKISGTYYQITTVFGNSGNTIFSAASAQTPYVAEAGETIAINISAQPQNVVGQIIEFDNTANVKTTKLTSLATGNNTLYTVTTGKTAIIIPTGIVPSSGTSSSIGYSNNSGVSRTIILYIVPNGGSAGATTQFSPSSTVTTLVVTAAGTGFKGLPGTSAALTMASQDSIVVNTDANTATQFAWVTFVEL